MFTSKFGIEIEFTGITRNEAAKVAADYLGGTVTHTGDYYDTKKVTTTDGRVWKIMSDSSISCQKKQGRQKVAATRSSGRGGTARSASSGRSSKGRVTASSSRM